MIYKDIQNQVIESLLDGEKDKTIDLFIKHSKTVGYKELIKKVLEPILVEWGTRWMNGELSLAHGYLSGKVAEEIYILASQSQEFTIENTPSKGTIVLGNIEDDFHPLGRRLVSIFAKSDGWNVVDLGNDILAVDFVTKAIEQNASIIAVSAMMFSTAKNIIKVRKELDKQKLSERIKLAVGGAVFKLNPTLVEDVGGDGTAENAIQAPDLFANLSSKVDV